MSAELIGQTGQNEQVAPTRLVIELVNGNVQVSGPINDRLLCFGLLELARQSLIEYGHRMARQQAMEQQVTNGLIRDIHRRK